MAEAEPASGISQELKERILAAATDHWNDFKANATAEQKEQQAVRFKKSMSDPEFQN